MPEKPIILTPLTKPITIRYSDERVAFSPETTAKIAAYWKQRSQENPHLFNGDAFTLTSLKETPETIEVEMAATNFANGLYAVNNDDYDEHIHRVFHSACLVITRDNKLVLGEMSKYTARAGAICCSGGSIDRGDIRGDTIDLDYSTTHEVREELGIDPLGAHAISYKPAYIKTGGPHDMATVLYELITDLSSEEFAKNYANFTAELIEKNEEIEFECLHYIDNTPEAVETFISEHKQQLDAYIPALLRAVSSRS
jgi:hypothetical protein